MKWNEVTRASQIAAIVLFVLVFGLGLFLGRKVGVHAVVGESISEDVFKCDKNQSIRAVYYDRAAHVAMSDGEESFLLQTISADGGRYATPDESLVFWNKGDTAIIMRNNSMDLNFTNCSVKN